MHRSSVINISTDLGRIHVRVVLEVLRQAVVLHDEGVEDLGEHLVGVGISGIDSAMLIVKLDSTSDGLKVEKEARIIKTKERSLRC